MNAFNGTALCKPIDGVGMTGMMTQDSLTETALIKSAVSEKALKELWPVFTEEVLSRLHVGAREYGDESFHRNPGELCEEVLQELDDVMGWGFVLWCRVKRLQERLKSLEFPSV